METTQQLLNILIVEDHKIFVDGLKVLLKKNVRIKQIFFALNGRDALEIIKKQNIDMVLTDLNMPEMSGLELTKAIKADYPQIKIIVLSMYNNKGVIMEIIEAEAEGYLLKNTDKSELFKAIDKVAEGGTYYNNEVLAVMMENTIKEKTIVQELSEREIEILRLICQEFTSAEIAEKLFLSPLTIETHRKRMLHKTNSKSVIGLMKYAIKFNLI